MSAKKQAKTENRTFLTTAETCAYLRVSRYWIYRHAGKPEGPPFYRLAGVLRFDKAELNAWVEASRKAAPGLPGWDETLPKWDEIAPVDWGPLPEWPPLEFPPSDTMPAPVPGKGKRGAR